MANTEEIRKFKAKKMRYKKPIAKNLNLDAIKEDLMDMEAECDNVRWYMDSDDGTDSLINALDGDEDEAHEVRIAFADLCADCERMTNDFEYEWVPKCFDIFFVAAGASDYEEILGWDYYEHDYFGIDCSDIFAEDEAKKQLKRMTKDNLIAACRQCFRIYQAYIGLRNRYDNLKAAIDILRDQNTGYLQVVKEIEKLYEKVSKDTWSRYEYSRESIEWKRYTNALPPEAWLI